ncbi:MAG: DUF4357 domain-containing protein, partial [Planctomycetota bacterium]
ESLINECPSDDSIFILEMKNKGVYAEAEVSPDPENDWIRVFEGAMIGEVTPSFKEKNKGSYAKERRKLESLGIIGERYGKLTLLQEHTFENYSEAACILSGNSLNGNDVWKDKDGKSLKERGLGLKRGQSKANRNY